MNELFVIVSQDEVDELGRPLYWSNQLGWVTHDQADRFESCTFRLPLGGKWEQA